MVPAPYKLLLLLLLLLSLSLLLLILLLLLSLLLILLLNDLIYFIFLPGFISNFERIYKVFLQSSDFIWRSSFD